jgi:3-dehydroquinate dehydratase-2
MRPAIHVLNGPNLNLLGRREPHLYGNQTLADLEGLCREAAGACGWDLVFHQTNHQHELIDQLEAAHGSAGVVLNPAAFCYGSVAIAEAMAACDCPVVEVHITNIHNREREWRSHTITAGSGVGMISGLGLNGYVLAIRHLAHLAQKREEAA